MHYIAANMIERIHKIMKTKELTASQFAGSIGVQPSSVSHVISGRNKPSLEFIQKILKVFPDLSADWLLFGSGNMKREMKDKLSINGQMRIDGNVETEIAPAIKTKPEIIDENHLDHEMHRKDPSSATLFDPIKQSSTSEKGKNDKRKGKNKSGSFSGSLKTKKAEKIVVLFNDRTFSEYTPED